MASSCSQNSGKTELRLVCLFVCLFVCLWFFSSLLALLAYLFNFISGLLVLLLEKESRYCQFHGAQSLALAIIFFPLWIIAAIIDAVVFIYLLGIGVRIIGLIVAIFYLAVEILCMYKAYTLCNHQEFRLPLVASFADFLQRTLRPDTVSPTSGHV